MDIGIIDADLLDRGTTHPNLSCMKLSGYHKNRGDNVKLIEDYEELNPKDFDRIYLAKVFNYTKIPIEIDNISNLIYGGTGFFYNAFCDGGEHMLPHEVEHTMPDYSLYTELIERRIENGEKRSKLRAYLEASFGFTTRGCFRHCKFCVNQHSNGVQFHAHVNEFLDSTRKYIYLWDDNILGYPKWREVFEELTDTKKAFSYRQGMDIRLMTDEKAQVLGASKIFGECFFSFDHITDREQVERGLRCWRNNTNKQTKLFCICGFKEDDVEDIEDTFIRISIIIKYRCIPYIMRHENYAKRRYRGMYINLARWCNQPSLFKKKSYREFCVANGENSACYRYMKEFEHDHPDIATKYFDIKWEQ